MVFHLLPPPDKITEKNCGFCTKLRLRYAPKRVGKNLTTEKAANWAPVAFHHLSNQAIEAIPPSTLTSLDKSRVRQFSKQAIRYWTTEQVLAVVDRLKQSQLQMVCAWFAFEDPLRLLEVSKRLSKSQRRMIDICKPGAMKNSKTLDLCLDKLPKGLGILALMTHYYEPSQHSTEELLQVPATRQQSLLRQLNSPKASACCFSEGGVSTKMAVITGLKTRTLKKVKELLEGQDLLLFSELENLLEVYNQRSFWEGYYLRQYREM